MEEEAVYLMESRKQIGKKGSRTKYKLQNHALKCPTSSSQAPAPKVCRTSKNRATSWGPSVIHMNLWYTFHIQTNVGFTYSLLLSLTLPWLRHTFLSPSSNFRNKPLHSGITSQRYNTQLFLPDP
jgi:hypothetical protein